MKLVQLVPPPAIALILLLLGFLGSKLFVPLHFIVFQSYTLGLIITIIGLGLILWAALLFILAKTPIRPHQTPKKLVTKGPYQFSRNPMYLGILCILLGCSLWQATLGVYLAAGIYFLFMDWVIVPQEEKTVKKSLGQPYLVYKKRVHRWL